MSHDYRIFVGAFPEGELAERIQAIRLQYDPVTARITAPHVTVAGAYWRSGPATAENETAAIARLEAASLAIRPIDLALGGIKMFPQKDKPVVYLGVELSFSLLAARQALQAALGPDKHANHFAPHLTLAMRLKAAKAQMMLAALQSDPLAAGVFTAPIRRLHLMQHGPSNPAWRSIAELILPSLIFLPPDRHPRRPRRCWFMSMFSPLVVNTRGHGLQSVFSTPPLSVFTQAFP